MFPRLAMVPKCDQLRQGCAVHAAQPTATAVAGCGCCLCWCRCLLLVPGASPSTRTNWSASISTVLRLNFLLQKLNRSSKLGPSRSMTITL